MTNNDAWITRQTAAEILGLSLRQVHRYVRTGRIQITRDHVTGRVYYFAPDVQSLMVKRAQSGAS